MKSPSYQWVLLLALLLLLPISSFAQSNPAIEIQPISGPPGTTVTIRDLGGNRGRTCFAQIGSSRAQEIGTMAGSLSYVVAMWCRRIQRRGWSSTSSAPETVRRVPPASSQ